MTEREVIYVLLKSIHKIALCSEDSAARAKAHWALVHIADSYLREGDKVRLDRIDQMVEDGLLVVRDCRYNEEVTGNEETKVYELIISGPLNTYALWVANDDPEGSDSVWSIDGGEDEEG